MKRTIGLLSLVAICAATMSLTISSCDSTATDPANPGNRGGGKGPTVLNSDQAGRTIGINRVGSEGTGIAYDYDQAVLRVENFNGGGFSSIPDEPAAVWTQNVDGEIAPGGGVSIHSVAEDGETSRIEIQRNAEEALVFNPSYTGHDDVDVFHIDLFDNGRPIGTIPDIPRGTAITAYPVNPGNPCCRMYNSAGFIVHPTNGACIWRIAWDPCCYWRIFWNGQWYEFNGANFVEGVTDGHYPYHHFTEIQVRPFAGGAERYDVTSEVIR